MANRDYTKYNVDGLGENLNKRSLVFTIVKDWIEKNNPTFEDLQVAFPDEIQGSKGFIRKEKDVNDPKRFNMREPLKIKNGAHVVVSNQWGKNIEAFIQCATEKNYKIRGNESSFEAVGNYELVLDSEFPDSFIEQLTNNRKNHAFLSFTNDFLEKKLRVAHDYFGAAKLFEAISNRFYENEADEFEAYYSYEIEDYEAAYKIVDDAWELKEILSESTLVDKILDLESLEVNDISNLDFKLYYCGYFKYVTEQLASREDSAMLAEFLVAQSLSYSVKIEEEGFNYGEDWLVEFVDKLLLHFYGIDVNNYQDDYSSDGYYFGISVDSSLNYEQIAQEIIESVN